MTTNIHPTAVIDPSARLADGVKVGPYAIIGPRVEIGAGTRVEAGAHVQGPSRIGEENRIFPYACVGFDPQDLKYAGEETWLEVGDRNLFREHCTINRGTAGGGGRTTIGDDNLFMTYTHVAHDCHVGNRTVFSNNGTLAGHVEVADEATVGAFSSIHQFCRLGRHAYIGGYSVVTRDALPYVKTVGVKPACYGINRIGLERKGFTSEEIETLETAYRILVRSNLNTTQALERLRAELGEDPRAQYLIDFVAGSQRGVIKQLARRTGQRGG